MKKILLDTNFLMIPAHFGIDVFDQIDTLFGGYELFIVERTLFELDKIAENGGQKEKRQVKLTKAIIKTQNIKIVNSDQETSVDDQLVHLALEGYIVATQDKALKRRIKAPCIIFRQKKYVEYDKNVL